MLRLLLLVLLFLDFLLLALVLVGFLGSSDTRELVAHVPERHLAGDAAANEHCGVLGVPAYGIDLDRRLEHVRARNDVVVSEVQHQRRRVVALAGDLRPVVEREVLQETQRHYVRF